MGPPYAHPNTASHPNVRTCEHAHTGSDHADPNNAAFCDADRCHGYGHRYGDECAADGDTHILGHADRDACAADGDTYTLVHADHDECAADGNLYAVGHADRDEHTTDCDRDSHAPAYADADASAAASLRAGCFQSIAAIF